MDIIDRHAVLLPFDTLVAEGTLPWRVVRCTVHHSFSGERDIGSLNHRSLDALCMASTRRLGWRLADPTTYASTAALLRLRLVNHAALFTAAHAACSPHATA